MSKLKTFTIQLFNDKQEVEEIVVRKFISVGELYDIAEKAERLEDVTLGFKEQLDEAMDLIVDTFKHEKTADGKPITRDVIKKRLSSDDFMETAKEIIMISTGQDPKALPPEIQ